MCMDLKLRDLCTYESMVLVFSSLFFCCYFCFVSVVVLLFVFVFASVYLVVV